MNGHQYLHNGATPLWSDAFSFSYIDEWAPEKQQKNKSAWERINWKVVNAKNMYFEYWLWWICHLLKVEEGYSLSDILKIFPPVQATAWKIYWEKILSKLFLQKANLDSMKWFWWLLWWKFWIVNILSSLYIIILFKFIVLCCREKK